MGLHIALLFYDTMLLFVLSDLLLFFSSLQLPESVV